MTAPTDPQPTPSTSRLIPRSPIERASPPIQKTYSRKQRATKIPSLRVSSPPQPEIPLMEHSPFENIQRVPIGLSPMSKKVIYKEGDDHLVRAHTTVGAQSVQQESMNSNKTQSKATLGEESSKGSRCQETKGEGSASSRQETSSKRSYDSPRVVKTPKGDEDRYTYEEFVRNLCQHSL